MSFELIIKKLIRNLKKFFSKKMAQDNNLLNKHIEEYLDYYVDLSHSPEFAVLLKGEWGSGKTWFINQYREKLKIQKKKCLYVSLYGLTSIREIEDKFFQQLFPIRSSKIVTILGSILQGFVRTSLKMDFNNDGNDDGSLMLQIPNIEIQKSLDNIDNSIIIFDDLERCNIDLKTILGYINYFVEHQDFKVIIVANEDKLLNLDQQDNEKQINEYQEIKEKLVGKTFCIVTDFDSALKDFINIVESESLKEFLSSNFQLVKDLYNQAEYNNLRLLRQIILDFELIFERLSEKAQTKSEFLQELFRTLMAFSFEIKRGNMLSSDIVKLPNIRTIKLFQEIYGLDDIEKKEPTLLEKILKRYESLNLSSPFPNIEWWGKFFEQGIIDNEELKKLYNLVHILKMRILLTGLN